MDGKQNPTASCEGKADQALRLVEGKPNQAVAKPPLQKVLLAKL